MASNVVLVHCGDHRENQRRLLALACDLRDRGWVPVMICYRSVGAFFLARGIDVFTLDRADEGAAGDLPHALQSHFDVLASLALGQTHAGVDTRSLLPTHSLGRRAEAIALYRVLRRVRRLRAMLLNIDPAHVLIWNGYTGVVANCLRQLCAHHGLAHGFLERGLLADSVFVDALGVNGHSQLHHQDLEQLRQGLKGSDFDGEVDLDLPGRTGQSVALRERHAIFAERVIFVPLQVQRDTNILQHSDHFKKMSDFVVSISDAVMGQDVTLVVRAHPEEVDTNLDLPSRENIRYINGDSVEDWCACADLTITINSTVGLTAILQGRPLVALGRAIYTGKGLCVESDRASLKTLLDDPKTYEAPRQEDVDVFRQACLGLHTAGPKHCPDLLGAPSDSPAPARPKNMYATDASKLASRWQRLLISATDALGGEHEVHVSNQLLAKDTADRSYRNTKAPVSAEDLQHGLGELLTTNHARFRVERGSAAASKHTIVVAPQDARPALGSGTVLVVDQYLDPHVQWLLRT